MNRRTAAHRRMKAARSVCLFALRMAACMAAVFIVAAMPELLAAWVL